MNERDPSEEDAYSNAKFLVDIFPEEAIDLLCERSLSGLLRMVEARVDRSCIKLRGAKYEIKGLVQKRQFDHLLDLKSDSEAHNYISPTEPVARNPNVRRRLEYHTGGQTPPPSSPSSMASALQRSQRIPNQDRILVYHDRQDFSLIASYSGSEAYLIGEDKLDRFRGLKPIWETLPWTVTIGGQRIEVAQHVGLTWIREEDSGTGTLYDLFGVVPAGVIRQADVLLGFTRRKSREEKDKASLSPLALDKQTRRMPSAPRSPQQALWPVSSSTAIYSHEDSGQPQVHREGATATMSAGPPSLENPAPPHPSSVDHPPSRSQSIKSTGTPSSSRSNIVLVKLSFHGIPCTKLISLDLAKHGDQILPSLESHIGKMSKGKQQLDRSIHEMVVTPIKENVASEICPLTEDEFDICWGGIVKFMSENRLPESDGSGGPEFVVSVEQDS